MDSSFKKEITKIAQSFFQAINCPVMPDNYKDKTCNCPHLQALFKEGHCFADHACLVCLFSEENDLVAKYRRLIENPQLKAEKRTKQISEIMLQLYEAIPEKSRRF
ncbi:MAG: hypothetical protein NTW06_01700 [Candidatus Falkowbacteria bacterium]|nr:hypothetical protein [Candidatus Falkowbacteria bacterium]